MRYIDPSRGVGVRGLAEIGQDVRATFDGGNHACIAVHQGRCDPVALLFRCLGEGFCLGWRAEIAVDDHTVRTAVGQTRQATGQFGIVGQNGLDADKDRVSLGAQQMAAGACFGTGDPDRFTVTGGYSAIGGYGEFQLHEGALPRLPDDMAECQPTGLISH